MNLSKKNLILRIFLIFILFLLHVVFVPFAESVTYTYDDANRLIHEEDGTGTPNNYIYDDDGNLNQKTAGSGGMFFLSVLKSGTGGGTVTSSETPVPSINCGSVCSASYVPDSVVRLTASPDEVSLFTGWSGDCTGSTNSIDVVMDRTKSCRALFASNTFTVTPSAGINGTISPSMPQTVNCNSTTSFTLTPDTGYHIASVSGCGGTLTGNTYTTGAITSDCSVTASFAINNYTVTPSAGPNGTISPSTPRTVNYNLTTSFTVTPNTGYHITSISGCGGPSIGAQPNDYPYTYTTGPITGDCTVTASFAVNTYFISGRVMLRTKGLSDVTITLSGAASATTTTDSSGNYTFSGLPNGAYTVTPSKAGYTFTPTSSSVTISGASVTGLNFTAK